MSKISIKNLVPHLSEDNTKSIQDLWDKFLKLNSIFSKCPQELTSMDIQKKYVNNVTPYIYATTNHVPEFLQLYGSILPITQQGLEKHNDITTKINFIFTAQIIKSLVQQNHLEYLRDIGSTPIECFQITCSVCNKVGHNATKSNCTHRYII